ncbi:MAG: DUF192 domain-containing protein [Gemmatimonadetes bacterium]|nr:DUF192 domain-containing protein [Gemmatimonadota bacterium]
MRVVGRRFRGWTNTGALTACPFALAGIPLIQGCGGAGGGAAAEVAPPAAADEGEDDQNRPPPGYAWVIFETDTVRAEVASTPEAREQGLMGRLEVPSGTGMLFVFPETELRSFWMKDTFVSLDIAFINESFEVVDIQQMEAEDTNLTDAAAPSAFALEVLQGWMAEHGIEVGDRVTIVFGPGLRVS